MLFRKTATVLMLLLCLSVFAVIFYINIDQKWEVDSWSSTLTNFMLLYLILIFFRTFLVVLFSFLEYVFVRDIDTPNHFPLVTILVPSFNEQVVI